MNREQNSQQRNDRKEGSEKAIMSNWGASKLEVWSFIISITAVGIAIASLYYSCQANRISENANSLSESLHYQTNRPRIKIRPSKECSGDYYSYKVRENGVDFQISLEVVNNGLTPATKIKWVKKHIKINYLGEVLKIDGIATETPADISLGPGDSFHSHYKNRLRDLDRIDLGLREIEEVLCSGKITFYCDVIMEYFDETGTHKHTVDAAFVISKHSTTATKYHIN